MKYQKNSELPFYTYILKDSGIGGSKEGIYSWIYGYDKLNSYGNWRNQIIQNIYIVI